MRSVWLIAASLLLALPAQAFQANLFSNVDFAYGRGAGSNANFRNGAFALGQADLFLTHSFNDHFHSLVEIAVSSSTTSAFSVSAERLLIGYDHSDLFGVEAGRYHTPIGYWNTAYHHGPLLHLSVARPFWLVFDGQGGLAPIHTVGLLVKGKTHGDKVSLTYRGFTGNGVRIAGINTGAGQTTGTLDPNNLRDNNKNKLVGIDLQVTPRWGDETEAQIGVSSLYHRVQAVNSDSTILGEVDQFLVALDLSLNRSPFQFLSEYFLYIDRVRVGGSGTSMGHALYGQIGYTLRRIWTPYLRWEQLRVETGDPYFSRLAASDRHVLLGGLHIDLPHNNVLKFEGRAVNFTRGTGTRGGEGIVQWAFGF